MRPPTRTRSFLAAIAAVVALAGGADCNHLPSDGCEADLNAVASCGACGVTCNCGECGRTCLIGTCEAGTCVWKL
jgi:hypothetical protein